MQRTLFDSPILSPLFRGLGKVWLAAFGWQVEGSLPSEKKFVVIAAPHTSNWDFPFMMAIAFHFRAAIFWMGKDSLFKNGMGGIARWLGGIAIDRSKTNNVVDIMVGEFASRETLIVAIPPEGTRDKVREWRSGFYHIANQAKVPLALAFLDYKRKVGGLGPTFYPTGNFEADMAEIKAFYAGIEGKYPQKTGLDESAS